MKNKLLIAGVIAIMVFMLAPLSTVMATEQTPYLTVSEHGIVWTIDLKHPFDTGYSGKDVVALEVFYYNEYYLNPNPPPIQLPVTHQLSYLKYSKTDVQIKIWIDTTDPNFVRTAEHSYVTLYFENGNVETYSGPGWAPFNVH